MLAPVLTILSLGVALVYFTIAVVVVPRIQLPGASTRFANIFTLGAVAFFVGCGLSHLHIAVHAVTEANDVRLHEIGFHVLQFFGGIAFVLAAVKFLEIQVEVKKSQDDRRLDHLEELATRDPLTGAYNRRYFEEELGRAVARHSRSGEPFAVAHIDIDDFKSVNDRNGHAAGDAVLKRLVMNLDELIRPTDTLVRFGGDEFGLILPGADSPTAMRVAERVRLTVAEDDSEDIPAITVSLGVASCPEHATSAVELLSRSDQALYRSKRSGKNRSTVSAHAAQPSLV